MRPASLLLLLAGCAGPAALRAPEPSAGDARCALRGGALAIVDAATGEPRACEPVVIERGGERLYAGETDARGLVPLDLPAGEALRVTADGERIDVAVQAPVEGLAVVELGDPGGRVRVLGEDGQPLPGLRVQLTRGNRTLLERTTSAFGVLARAPEDLSGVVASAEGVKPAPVDAASRTVVLVPAERPE